MLGLSPRSPMQLDQLSNFNIREFLLLGLLSQFGVGLVSVP